MEQDTGSARGRNIRKSDIKPYAALVSRYIADHGNHPAIQAALRWLNAYVYGREHPLYILRHKSSPPEQRLSRFLRRMVKDGVQCEEMLATVTALFLMREHDPICFPSDQHYNHQLARAFLRLAPAPFMQTYNGGKGAKKYDRITLPMGRYLSKRITESIGVACLNMARTIHAANRLETGLLRGINVPFNFT